jgi:putative PIG3 family NAD(P)H quinone oxidoreductase
MGDGDAMRAVVITRPGGPEVLEVRDAPKPVPGPGELLVRVRAAGLNRADVLQRQGRYPAPPGSPADIPGLEYAGEVAALGPLAPASEAADRSVPGRAWAVGDRAMGIVGGGACAEYLLTPADAAIAVPEAWSLPHAAAVPEVFLTAYDALIRQLGLRQGDTVLIHAVTSGVGTAAVQLARAVGARTIGTSRSAEKLRRVAPLGLDVAVDSSREDFVDVVRRSTDGRGVDVVLDLVGGPVLAGNLAALAPRGRMIVVGLTAGRTAPLDLGTLLSKRLTIVGTALRSRTREEKAALVRVFEREVMPLFASGRLAPVLDRTYPMTDVAQAHRAMESDAHVGKLVLVW